MSIDNDYSNSLVHYGVLGMKWGVRRYQNKDGTLTDAGEKRYSNMNGEQLYKSLRKQVRDKRQEVHGLANRFMTQMPIGEHTNKLIEDSNAKRKVYESSEKYKEWNKKVKQLEKRSESMDPDKFDSEWKKLMSEKPEKDFNDVKDLAVIYGAKGRVYINNFINKAGKDLSLAYLKDLGYSEDVAKDFVQKMIKSNRTLGAI